MGCGKEKELTLLSWDKNLRILCPCGERITSINRLLALSRRASITVCERCGPMETLKDAGFMKKKPLGEWAVMKKKWTL